MTGTYRIAGYTVEITSLYRFVHLICEPYAVTAEPDFTIEISEADIAAERVAYQAEMEAEGQTVYPHSDESLESTAVARKLTEKLLEYGILLLHGSVIAVDGEAYLFTAKSGTGKSTHTRLWREYFGDRAVMVNDDKPFIAVTKEGAVAYGSPWNGKHHLGENTSCKLKAICELRRGEENRIERVSFMQIYPMLLQQCHRPSVEDEFLKTMTLLEGLEESISFYVLHCNMEPEAAVVAYEGMK